MCNLEKVVRCQKRNAPLPRCVERNAPGEASPSRAPSHVWRQQPKLIEEALDALVCALCWVTNSDASVWTRRVSQCDAVMEIGWGYRLEGNHDAEL